MVGWPLEPLSRLDRAGARGLVSDLTVAGPLTRQAAYVVAAAILERGDAAITDLTASFAMPEVGAEAVGLILRRQRAREIVAAVFGVRPTAVPGGFVRALQRIQEGRSEAPGLDPLVEPSAYRRLFQVLTEHKHSPAAHGLRYCGPLRAMHVRAVDELDPILVVPEVVRTMHGEDSIRRANGVLTLIRRCVSDLDEAELTTALRQSLGHGDALSRFGRRMLERADRLPVPDLPPLDGLRILASADAIRAYGETMANCIGSYVCEVGLGLRVLAAYTHIDQDGATIPLTVVLTPLVGGGWEVEQVAGHRNDPVPRPVLRVVLKRLMSIGIQISGPAPGSTYDKEVADLLGFHRWYRSSEALRATVIGDDAEDTPADGMDDLVSALNRMEELA